MRASAWRCTGEEATCPRCGGVRAACSWTRFDDLADSTPGARDGEARRREVLRLRHRGRRRDRPVEHERRHDRRALDGPGSFSTLELDPAGKDQNLGDSETLGQHTIDSLTGNAQLLFDGVGSIALVDNSNVGTIIVITGNTSGLTVDTQVGTSAHPVGTAFANGELVVAVDAMAGMANVFSVKGTAVVNCTLNDNASMPLAAAALAIDGTKLWAYAKNGAFFGYDLAATRRAGLRACNLAPTSAVAMAGAAMNGGHIDMIAGKYAIVDGLRHGHDHDGSGPGRRDLARRRARRHPGRGSRRAQRSVRELARQGHGRARLSEPSGRDHRRRRCSRPAYDRTRYRRARGHRPRRC